MATASLRSLWIAAMLNLLMAVAGRDIAAASGGKSIAVTIDDLPIVAEGFSVEVSATDTQKILTVLKKHHVVAMGFVNEDKLFVTGEVDTRIRLLTRWPEAGMDLGNHGFGHLSFETTPLAEYEDAVIKGEVVTRPLTEAYHKKLQYYRFPYNQTGPTLKVRNSFQAFLLSRGYKVAPFTVEDDDAVFAKVYADDIKKGALDEAARISASYLNNLHTALHTFEMMSQQLYNRQIAQILLIHANHLNADTLDQTLTAIEIQGYRFVSLPVALEDPAYASPDGYVGKYGMSWLHRWAIGLHRQIWPLGQPDPENWILDRFAELAPISVQHNHVWP